MMTPTRNNTAMFRRLLRRLLFANRGRLFVILLALSAGAAVSAALLNLQTDAKRRINSEFRSFGPNILISPNAANESQRPSTFSDTVLQSLPLQAEKQPVPAVATLFVRTNVIAYSDEGVHKTQIGSGPVILAGYRGTGKEAIKVLPHRVLNPEAGVVLDAETCDVGKNVATKLNLHFGTVLQWKMNGKEPWCVVSELQSFGGPEDDHVFVDLETLQEASQMRHQVSVIELSVSGTTGEIEKYAALVQQEFPNLEVRPLRQFSEAQAKIYTRISGLLTAATALILALTVLCIMAAMTNIAAERKNDVGMMKAIGGSARRVLNLFLTEAVLLGLVGGIIGSAVGLALSMALGKAVFGIAAAPRLIVYPISVALTVLVAILGAYPLRRLANVRPATIFRGDV